MRCGVRDVAMGECQAASRIARLVEMISDVPEKLRDELAARAAMHGQSLEQFLLVALQRLAVHPSLDAWL